jgi:type VI secretion system secreted protein VgrG
MPASAPLTQIQRTLLINTPLGTDKVLLRSFTGEEAVSRMFRFTLELSSDDFAIGFDDIVGKNVTFAVLPKDREEPRYFNGYVSRFVIVPNEGRLARYRAEVVPWLWFLTRTTDCRSFLNKTTPEIVQQIFSDFGFSSMVDVQLSGTYQPWEFCVQYRETAADFVMRLLEHEGIYFFFKHENGKHTMVLGDAPSVHQPLPDHPTVRHQDATDTKPGEDQITQWEFGHELRPGKSSLNDYNFETPAANLLDDADSVISQGPNTSFGLFDYPGEYKARDAGTALNSVRMEAEEAWHKVAVAKGNVRAMTAGHKFTLSGHARSDQNGEYLVLSVHHAGSEPEVYSGTDGKLKVTGPTYDNTVVCIPAAVPYRPPRITPRPRIHGTQPALVVGKSGEEIWTDSHGRVILHFHWDRRSKKDENSSCWIRVSQNWAGKGFGGMWLPRIGQEVLVAFLEGDPNRPVVVGRVYNADQVLPYALPAEQTKSYLKTFSSKGGGGFNEIRFEDKKDSEQIFVHAQKNMDVRVLKDRMTHIGQDEHKIVVRDEKNKIDNDRIEKIGRDHVENVVRDHHLKIDGKEAIKIVGSRTVVVEGDVIEEFKAKHSMVVTDKCYLKADEIVMEGGTHITIKVGNSYIAIESSGIKIGTTGTIELESSGKTSIKASAEFETESSSSTTIKSGSTMTVQASAPMTLSSDATAELKSSATTVKGDSSVVIKGGTVAIN